MPSAVDSSVALTSDSASRRSVAAALRASFWSRSVSKSDSVRRHVIIPTRLMARMNPAWTIAQVQGWAMAAGWLYTAPGESTPTTPWCTTTKPMADRKGRQSW